MLGLDSFTRPKKIQSGAYKENEACSEQAAQVPPTRRMPKNNSFDEKSNPSVKAAIQASLAGEGASEPDSPFMRRGRGMTDGLDEHQIKLLNSNTHGMIRQNVGMLQRQNSVKKSTMMASQSNLDNFFNQPC